MPYTKDRGIVVNPDLLSEDFLPENIPGREGQITELSICLRPALKRRKPLHAWLYGKPGCGKTATAKYVLRQLESEAGIRGMYVNCWENCSFHFVLSEIMKSLRILHTDQSNTPLKLEKFKKFLKNDPFVLVLDEVDQIPLKERENAIYNLATLGNLGIIAISNSRVALLDFDDRVSSRLTPTTIEFLPYTTSDLIYILRQRAELSLLPGSWTTRTLESIAALSEGDARVAIQTLKNAAFHAENGNDSKIAENHIERALKKAKWIKVSYQLKKLTPDHRVIYQTIKEHPSIHSDQLWQAYLEATTQMNMEPIANRTFSKYCAHLKNIGLIRIQPAKVKDGNIRSFLPATV